MEEKVIKKENKDTKEFDYKLLLDIMDKASKFTKVKVIIKNVVEMEIDNTIPMDEEILQEKPRLNVYNNTHVNEDTGNYVGALKEIHRQEELLLTDPDAYFEKVNKGEIR